MENPKLRGMKALLLGSSSALVSPGSSEHVALCW